MDCDVCFICHGHIDYAKLDDAFPHLCEGPDYLPPEDMTELEECIYWGAICLDCARSAGTGLPEKPRFRIPPPPGPYGDPGGAPPVPT